MTESQSIKALLAMIPTCDGVASLSCEIANFPNFFPGGLGFVGPVFPTGGVMIIGNNFGSVSNYEVSKKRGTEFICGVTRRRENLTWYNIINFMLPESKIPIEDCFFTNTYLGAIDRPNTTSNRGSFLASAAYKSACMHALYHQVEIMNPRLVVLLGCYVPNVFGRVFPAFSPFTASRLGKNQEKLGPSGRPLELISARCTQVVALVHPSNPRSDESHKNKDAYSARRTKPRDTSD